jgi:hypothetical protein
MTHTFMGGNPISLDLNNIFGATLEPSEALLLGAFLKFDKNDDGLLQLNELKSALNYLNLPGKNVKKQLSKKDIAELDLKTFVLIVKFLVVGTEDGSINEEIGADVAEEIFNDSNLVFDPYAQKSNNETDMEKKVDFNTFIDRIKNNQNKTTTSSNDQESEVDTPQSNSSDEDDSVQSPVSQEKESVQTPVSEENNSNTNTDSNTPQGDDIKKGGNKKSRKNIYKRRRSIQKIRRIIK